MVNKDEIILTLSPDRLQRYLEHAGGNFDTAMLLYAWNTRVSESLYPVLHASELALRNSIHRVLSDYYGQEDWYNVSPELDEGGKNIVRKAIQRIEKNKYQATPGRIVAELSFGFWVAFFNHSYESKLWPKPLATTLPLFHKGKTLKTTRKHYIQIKDLRNRVFHYERIIHWNYLRQYHQKALDSIGWISPSLLAHTQKIDRFTQVYDEFVDTELSHLTP